MKKKYEFDLVATVCAVSFLLGLFFATVANAEVSVNNTRPVDDTKQWVMVTLTVDGDVCRITTVQPWNTIQPVLSGTDLESYANSRENWLSLNILKQMYPGARYTTTEGQTELEVFEAWITAGHTNAAYCPSGQPYCTTEAVPAYCEGQTADNEPECLQAGGTWVPEVPKPTTEETCVEPGEWITVFDTEAKCLLANAQWIPEEVITKVPWVDSHEYTGTLRDRKLEELNADQTAYIAAHYDQGTQSAFTAFFVLPTTPQVVKDALLPVWTWIQGVTQYYYSKKIEIRDGENWNDVTWDFSQFDATDPHVSLEALMGG